MPLEPVLTSRRRQAAIGLTIALMLTGCSSTGNASRERGANTTHPDAEASTLTSVPEDAGDRVPNPMVATASGGRGHAGGGLRYDLTQFGYREQEFFFEGGAKAFPPNGGVRQPYRSRMIVWTPTDPAAFNGTTVVEWAHVSDFGQFELTIELNYQSPMLEAEGYAFVLVSAEEGGICDLGPSGCSGMSLKAADPERYSTLNHPGDPYSFDIFSQALQAIKHPTGTPPLGDLTTEHLVVEGFQASIDKWFPTGASDPSSFTSPFGIYGSLNAYLANGADDDARLADGFLIDGAAPLDPPEYRVPTLHHLDESAIRRVPTPDGPHHVTWEVVGAAHADRWTADHFRLPTSTSPKLDREEELARRDQFDDYGLVSDAGGMTCAPGRTTGSAFPRRFTLDAAVVALTEWVKVGRPAPAAPRIERTAGTPDSPESKLARDGDGVAVGGLRSPLIEVPVATYNGEGCVEAGTMATLPPERLAALYPSHERYVQDLLAVTDRAVNDRFLICQDAETLLRKASASTIGGTDGFAAAPRCATSPRREATRATVKGE